MNSEEVKEEIEKIKQRTVGEIAMPVIIGVLTTGVLAHYVLKQRGYVLVKPAGYSEDGTLVFRTLGGTLVAPLP